MEQSKQIRFFFFGQHLADGIRVTLTIIIPALAGAFWGDLESGIHASLGALCLSISDAPGPVKHKRNGMFYCLLFVIVMSLLTGFSNHSIWRMGLLVTFSTFFFSMFNIYGSRAASVASAALLIMILRMSHLLPAQNVLIVSGYIALGGIWYMVIALSFYLLVPYRPVQRALGDCMAETAKYLKIKSSLYDIHADLATSYEKLIAQQSVVNDKQNEVRELLFKTRAILKESTYESRRLLIAFVDTVDLFEKIMAIWYNYEEIRKKYGDQNVLATVSRLISGLADELTDIGEAIHSQTGYTRKMDLISRLDELKTETETATAAPLDITLRKIIINLRDLGKRVESLSHYFSHGKQVGKTNLSQKDFVRFVPHQRIDGTLFINNLNMRSSAFRHSLRVMITCAVGYYLAKMIFTGNHSYWILMTIIIIMKPAYSLTKEKNIDRFTGTLAGGIIGLLLLAFVKNDIIVFGFMIFCMLGTYTFVRLNYAVMVIFLTPYVLILFHFLKLNVIGIAGERLLDTAIACVLAWFAMHFLFPNWESQNIKSSLVEVLKANVKYLQQLYLSLTSGKLKTVEYKLVRKEVFVATANLSAALHRMQSEPKSKQQHKTEIYELVVLNHVLSSNIASLINLSTAEKSMNTFYFNKIKNSIDRLETGIEKISEAPVNPKVALDAPVKSQGSIKDESIMQQLGFIERLSYDIHRILMKIRA